MNINNGNTTFILNGRQIKSVANYCNKLKTVINVVDNNTKQI